MKRTVLVIPDSGPLISLSVANRLDLLLKLDMPIYVVDQVFYECTKDLTKIGAQAILGSDAIWVKYRAVSLRLEL